MNVCAFTGRFTADPQLKYTQSQKAVCSFTLAVDIPGGKDKVAFVDFVSWGSRAEFISKYFSKGMKIEITGFLSTRVYESNGKKTKVTEVFVEQASFAERKQQTKDSVEATEKEELTDGFQPIEVKDDDLPF